MSAPPPPPRRRDAPTFVAPAPATVGPAGRAAPRATAPNGGGSGSRRWLWIVVGVVVIALIAGGAVLALGGGGGKSSPTVVESTNVDLTPGATKVQSVAAPLPVPSDIPADVRTAILRVIGTYVDKGIVAGLRKGKADDAALTPVFDPGAAAALAGPDRAVLLDEGLPKAIGKLTVKAVPVPLTALSTGDGKILLVVAGIDFDIKAAAQQGTVTVRRTGSMTFALQITGEWRITAWKLHVDRNGPGIAPPPATAAPAVTTTTTKK